MIKAILIDIGHGLGPTGKEDNGGSANGTTERAEVTEIGLEVMKYIQKQPSLEGVVIYLIGYPVRMKLEDHVKAANDLCKGRGYGPKDAVLLSVHTNMGGGSGIEAWYEDGNAESQTLCQKALDAVADVTGLPKRRALPDTQNRYGRLGIVRDVIPTAILVECGFLDNPTDFAVIGDDEKDDKFAIGIVKGLVKYLGLTYTEISTDGPFPDVPKDRWSAAAIARARDAGWMTGYGDGLFRPERPVTREELAVILDRAIPPKP